MSSEQDEHDGRELPGTASPNPRPLWRRTGVWIGGVIAAALATVVATTFTQVVDWFAVSLGTSGEPVVVRVDVDERLEDVVLPPASTLSDAERGRLTGISPERQVEWLVENESGHCHGVAERRADIAGQSCRSHPYHGSAFHRRMRPDPPWNADPTMTCRGAASIDSGEHRRRQ